MVIPRLEYVLALNRTRHFGRAAEQCFVTQSTLSTMVARFEKEMGVTLFDRRKKPILVTAEGEVVISQLLRIAKEIDHLKDAIDGLKGDFVGNLSIGVIPTIAPFVLPYFLNSFARDHPKMTFKISELKTNSIVDSLLKRELDIGLVSLPLNESELNEYPLYNEPFVLYDSHLSNTNAPVDLKFINYDRFWMLEDGHCLRSQVESICGFKDQSIYSSHNFDYKPNSIDGLLRFVQKNQGVTLLPYLSILEFSKQEKRKVRFFEEPVPARNIGLVVHKHFVKMTLLKQMQFSLLASVLPRLESFKPEQKVIHPN